MPRCRISRKLWTTAGPARRSAASHAPAAAMEYFNWRKTTIFGGSNEIQKNIIAKMILGL